MTTPPQDQQPPAAQPDEPTPPPAKRPRRRRPHGRWTNPASPLQAARFARREGGKTVIMGIRKLCPGHGHGNEPCKIDVSKLSDYEAKRRRPSIEHIEAFARYYGRSPEDLGLINWRDQPTAEPDEAAPATPDPVSQGDHDSDPTRLLHAWLRDSVAIIAAAVLKAVAECPVSLTGEERSGQQSISDDDS